MTVSLPDPRFTVLTSYSSSHPPLPRILELWWSENVPNHVFLYCRLFSLSGCGKLKHLCGWGLRVPACIIYIASSPVDGKQLLTFKNIVSLVRVVNWDDTWYLRKYFKRRLRVGGGWCSHLVICRSGEERERQAQLLVLATTVSTNCWVAALHSPVSPDILITAVHSPSPPHHNHRPAAVSRKSSPPTDLLGHNLPNWNWIIAGPHTVQLCNWHSLEEDVSIDRFSQV